MIKGITPCRATAAHGVTEATARKWWGRYLVEGEAGLHDRPSRPEVGPKKIKPEKAVAIVELRRRPPRIAAAVTGLSKSAVGRVLKRSGLSWLSDLEPSAPLVGYTHGQPRDLIHIDTKKLRRLERRVKRIPGSPRSPINGWMMYPDEPKASAVQFPQNTVAYFRALGAQPKRILADNGSAFRSGSFTGLPRSRPQERARSGAPCDLYLPSF